jgi:methylase of polypeptide subunit release factors
VAPSPANRSQRIARGDWQTPAGLAQLVLELTARHAQSTRFASVLEPTCGEGSLLVAAASTFPEAKLLGFELNTAHVAVARQRLGQRARVAQADCFAVDWEKELRDLPSPLLLLGNPPWVTTATLGAVAGSNSPPKRRRAGMNGLEAKTGRANFDISEWILERLLEAAIASGKPFCFAMLCKAAVARKLLETASNRQWKLKGSLHTFDAQRHFSASVEAVLLQLSTSADALESIPVYAALDAKQPDSQLGFSGGELVRNLAGVRESSELEGTCELEWRSGIKHDCASIVELERTRWGLQNSNGEQLQLEPDLLFPFMKGADLLKQPTKERWLLVPQRRIGEDTQRLEAVAPRTWAYLSQHRSAFAARKSSIYKKQPDFAIFGVGPYSFAEYKVGISALAKRLHFEMIEPRNGKPVMLDDTCYFLPCNSAAQAQAFTNALNSSKAKSFLDARIFWDAKRPITKRLLSKLSLKKLMGAEEFSLAYLHSNAK